MDDRVNAYLEQLEAHLRGRMPKLEVDQAVMEARSHLYDLVEEQGGPNSVGAVTCALSLFGPARRFARRLLLSRQAVPPPWRAAIWPIGVAAAYFLVMILAPTALLERMIAFSAPAGYDFLYLTTMTAWLVVLIGFYRARQILWKPLVAASCIALAVASLTGPAFYYAVPIGGGSVQVINRAMSDRLAAQTRQEIDGLAAASSKLSRGKVAFAGDAREVQGEFRAGDLYLTPSDVADETRWHWSDEAQSHIPGPLFVTENVLESPRPISWRQAADSWKQGADSLLVRVRKAKARREAVLAGMGAASKDAYWVTVSRCAGAWFWRVYWTAWLLLQNNLIAWLLWLVTRRLVWPRRRCA